MHNPHTVGEKQNTRVISTQYLAMIELSRQFPSPENALERLRKGLKRYPTESQSDSVDLSGKPGFFHLGG